MRRVGVMTFKLQVARPRMLSKEGIVLLHPQAPWTVAFQASPSSACRGRLGGHFPQSKNYIMKRLATQNRALFVNSLTLVTIGSNPDFFVKIRRKLRSYLRWLRKVAEGLYVLTPIALPLYDSKTARALNRI